MPIDWSATGSWMQAWAGFAQAGSVLVAAAVAANTFNSWRRQKLEERRIDAAESILSHVYKVRQALSAVRNPTKSQVMTDEAVFNLIQSGLDIESYDLEKRSKIVDAQIILDRINRYSGLWNDFSNLYPLSVAIFGNDLSEPLNALWKQKAAIQTAAEIYPSDLEDNDLMDEVNSTLWKPSKPTRVNDKFSADMDGNISAVEKILLPLLRFDCK